MTLHVKKTFRGPESTGTAERGILGLDEKKEETIIEPSQTPKVETPAYTITEKEKVNSEPVVSMPKADHDQVVNDKITAALQKKDLEAKKKTVKKVEAALSPSEKTNMVMRKDLHQRLKIICALEDVFMFEMIDQELTKFVEREEKRLNIVRR